MDTRLTDIDFVDIDHVWTTGWHSTLLRFDSGALPNGLYLARISSGTLHATQKLVLLR